MKRIAFDFDGVIANTDILKRKWLLEFLGKSFDNVSKTGIYSELTKTCLPSEAHEIYKRMSLDVFTRENLMKTEMMDKSIPEILNRLSQNCELFIITKRPFFMLEWVRDWLCANGIDSFFTEVLSSSDTTKGEIAAQKNINVLVDDDINNLNDGRIDYNLLFGSFMMKDWRELYKYIIGTILPYICIDSESKQDK